MPPETHSDAERVRANPNGRSRLPTILGIVLIAALAGGGVWVAVAKPFADRGARAVPVAAEDNLLGAAWSFETTEDSSPSRAWTRAGPAPVGFTFAESAAVSGEVGAVASPAEGEYARIVSTEAWKLDGRTAAVELAGESSSEDIQLFVRFVGEGRAPLDVPVASGRGSLRGQAPVLPGYRSVHAGVGAVGPGSVDDLALRLVGAADVDPELKAAALSLEQGVYTVRVGQPPGMTVFRGQDLVLRVEPGSVRDAEGRLVPGAAAQLPGDGSVALAGGGRVRLEAGAEESGRRLVLRASFGGVPPGSTIVHAARVSGALADAPVGIRSARGYERFTGDFRVENVDALVLGRTQDRMVFEMDRAFTLAASHDADGTIALRFELPGAGDVVQELVLTSDFREERVQAAQLLEEAEGDEAAGRLGAALARLQRLVTEFPYDEQVLSDALLARARVQATMQEELDRLDRDLEDALFLGSAQRCREVREEALAQAELFAGSEAEALFRQRAREVEKRAARLLAEDVERRRRRLTAQLESFREHGGYELVAEELQDTLDRHLRPAETSGPSGEDSP